MLLCVVISIAMALVLAYFNAIPRGNWTWIFGIGFFVVGGLTIWAIWNVRDVINRQPRGFMLGASALLAALFVVCVVGYTLSNQETLIAYEENEQAVLPFRTWRSQQLTQAIAAAGNEREFLRGQGRGGPLAIERQYFKMGSEDRKARDWTVITLLGLFLLIVEMAISGGTIALIYVRPHGIGLRRFPQVSWDGWGGNPPSIFISYYRKDTRHAAARLAFDLSEPELVGRQGVFRDVTGILLGEEFPTVLRNKVNASDIVLALVGSNWLDNDFQTGRPKLWNRKDWVRRELVMAAYKRRRIVPIFLDGATIPSINRLPRKLIPAPAIYKRIAKLQGLQINDENWDSGVMKLVEQIGGRVA